MNGTSHSYLSPSNIRQIQVVLLGSQISKWFDANQKELGIQVP